MTKEDGTHLQDMSPHQVARTIGPDFGALGGSSLVMGAMDAWGLMGASKAAQ